MIFVSRSEPLLGVGWVLLTFILFNWLSPTAASLALLTLAVAEGVGSMLLPRHDLLQVKQSKTAGSDLERIFLFWTFIVPGLFSAIHFGGLHFYANSPQAALCLAALCLLVPLLKLCQRHGRLPGVLAPLRLIFLSMLAIGLQKIGVEQAELFLLTAVLLMLSFLLLTFRPLLREMQAGAGNKASVSVLHGCAPLALRQVDLLVLPFVLPPTAAVPYLIARGFGACVSVTLDQLIGRAYRSVANRIEEKSNAAFPVVEAARVNLGVLLVGGAIGLALLGLLPYLPKALGPAAHGTEDIGSWLILATLGPAFFGAAPAFLRLAGLQREMAALCFFSTLAFATMVIAQPNLTMLNLAQMTAFVQLSTAAVASGLLAWRTGVWPGLTAILFRQIRLL